MPSKFSFIFILTLGAGLVITAAYFMSYASTGKTVIQESRQMEYQSIEHLSEHDSVEYTSQKWKIDNLYDALLNLNILHKEAAAWGIGVFSILLIMLGILDFRLYRRRLSRYQKEILVTLVENHIDPLLGQRDNNLFTDKYGNRNDEKWNFEKSVFIENVLSKENTGRLMFTKEEISAMIDQIIDGTLE